MRKILLATTALVAFAGAAQAAESPITVNVGGYVDFRAALFREATNNETSTANRRSGDFETEYRINFSAEGKAANGIEYGAMIGLWNGRSDYNGTTDTAGRDTLREDQAYVWMSGAWGKFIAGDEHGASDLFTYAPTVGEGQIDGSYTDFTDHGSLAVFHPVYFDALENNTKITYYTPKVGNANHKVQVGASYTPNYSDKGQNTVLYNNQGPAYKNAVESTVRYTGTFGSVGVVASGILATGEGEKAHTMLRSRTARDYFGAGFGSQLTYAGFTLGGSYVDAGHLGTVAGQNRTQNVWNAGLKYEFDKVALAVNGMEGMGYYNAFSVQDSANTFRADNYVKHFDAVGFGATYTWFPGMTTAADVVLFTQERADTINGAKAQENDGHVLMISQKLAF